MSAPIECAGCGIVPSDFPYEELGMSLEEVAEFMFVHDGDDWSMCNGCAE